MSRLFVGCEKSPSLRRRVFTLGYAPRRILSSAKTGAAFLELVEELLEESGVGVDRRESAYRRDAEKLASLETFNAQRARLRTVHAGVLFVARIIVFE